MKKVFIVSKTHLDLGFTGLASEILHKYVNEFFPNCIKIAKEVNKTDKRFVWTVGSWLLKKALESGTPDQQKELSLACQRGDIVAHGMAFTTHTELMDKDLVEYSLSIIKDLDKKFNRTTIAAKMTDVPGHTIALVPLLAQSNIKLLHIGVNGASAVPNLPQCFLWKCGESEVIVIYDGNYGGEYKSEYLDEVLYFDHSLDNHGPRDVQGVLNHLEKIKAKYPDYQVVAGTLDDFAERLWTIKDKLPIITSEIGDSWIHGTGTDPYKVGGLKTLLQLKNKWITNSDLSKTSNEYKGFMDSLMCVAEHTWGLDMKCSLGDYNNYLRKDFDEARQKDIRIRRRGILRLKCFKKLAENGKHGVYSKIESSWEEQRKYLVDAIGCLSVERKDEALKAMEALRPKKYFEKLKSAYNIDELLHFGDWTLSINKFGGIGALIRAGETIVAKNANAVLQYHSYGQTDYDFWFKHYTRDFSKTWAWSIPDFGRPFLKKIDKKYRQGRFDYKMSSATFEQNDKHIKIAVMLSIDDYCYNNLGASKDAQIIYTLTNNGLEAEVIWCNKPASRLTEAIFFRFFPNTEISKLKYCKIGEEIDPYDVTEDGNRNISCVENICFFAEKERYQLANYHSPLVSLGKGKILQFDNKYEDVSKDGVSFILYNNIWGTNFPLWYGENAYFKFNLTKILTKKGE